MKQTLIRCATALGAAVSIAWGAQKNAPPTADAGPDTSFIKGLSYVLRAKATDDSLSLWDLSYGWRQIDGPTEGADLQAPQARNSNVVFSLAGVYRFELSVSDGAHTIRDTVVVTVMAEIPFVVTSPDTGDTLYSGRHHMITWQVYPPTGMILEFSVDNGRTWTRLNETKVDMYDTSFAWNIADTFPESDNCFIKVYEYGQHEITALSGRFSLRHGSDAVVVPLRRKLDPSWGGLSFPVTLHGRKVTQVCRTRFPHLLFAFRAGQHSR